MLDLRYNPKKKNRPSIVPSKN
jgi:hypothetical protein